jgi:hypothetical protein
MFCGGKSDFSKGIKMKMKNYFARFNLFSNDTIFPARRFHHGMINQPPPTSINITDNET